MGSIEDIDIRCKSIKYTIEFLKVMVTNKSVNIGYLHIETKDMAKQFEKYIRTGEI